MFRSQNMLPSSRQNASSRIFLLIAVLLSAISTISADPPEVRTCGDVAGNVIIEAKTLGVTWDGWGTSLGWWANWAGGLPADRRNRLLDLIFSGTAGLGFNIVRYNIGGGGYSNVSRFQSGQYKFRAIPGYKWTRASPYDWGSDSNQRVMLAGAKQRGATIIEAYSNSPPAWMTISKDFTGSAKRYEDNLHPRDYGAFADYLTDVVRQFRTKWGITFRTLEPFNEPTEGGWLAGGVQEGCNFNGTSIDRFIPVLASKLRAKRLPTKISAADSLGKNTPRLYSDYLSKKTKALISQYNVHTYESRKVMTDAWKQIRYRSSLAGIAATEKKKFWVSEWGPYSMRGSEMDIALGMARFVMMDINILHASAWVYWQAVEEFGREPYWGLIFSTFTYSRTPFVYRIRPQYYVMMQFSKWVRKGDVPLQVHSSCQMGLLVTYSARFKRLVIIAANYLKGAQTFTVNIKFATVPGKQTRYAAYRTSLRERHKLVVRRTIKLPSKLQISMTPRSVTTYIFSYVKWK